MGLLFGRIILGALLGALAVGTTAYIVHKVLTKNELKKLLSQQGIKRAIVEQVNKNKNIVSIRDLINDERIEYQGNGIGRDVIEGEVINS